MKMNARMFTAKTTVSHTAYAGMRSEEGICSGAVLATVIA